MTAVWTTEVATGQPVQLVATDFSRHPLSADVRAEVYPVCPEAFAALVAAEDQLDELLAELRRPRETLGDYLKRVTDDLAAGEPLPDGFATAARGAVEAEDSQALELAATQSALRLLTEHWKRAAAEHGDEVLLGLRVRLEELVGSTRAAARALGDVDLLDGEAVADATPKQQQAVLDLKTLRPAYRRLRGLQRQLVESILDDPWHDPNPFDASRWKWPHLWATRVHEFSGADLLRELDAEKSQTWYRPIVDREDVWLPTMPELKVAWAEIRKQVPSYVRGDRSVQVY